MAGLADAGLAAPDPTTAISGTNGVIEAVGFDTEIVVGTILSGGAVAASGMRPALGGDGSRGLSTAVSSTRVKLVPSSLDPWR